MALTLSTGMFAGRAVELFGYRKVALGGSILFVGSLVAAGFCRTIPALILTQGVLSGIGAGILFIPAAAGAWLVFMLVLRSQTPCLPLSTGPVVSQTAIPFDWNFGCWFWCRRNILVLRHSSDSRQARFSVGTMAFGKHIGVHLCHCTVLLEDQTNTTKFQAHVNMEQPRHVQGSQIRHSVPFQWIERIWVCLW